MANINNLLTDDGKRPITVMFPKDDLQYRFDFRNWIIADDAEVDINSTGTIMTIKKFNPKSWIARTNESDMSNTHIAEIAKHWKFELKGMEALYATGKINMWQFRQSTDEGGIYYVRGFMPNPWFNNGNAYFLSRPWDSDIPSGKFRDGDNQPLGSKYCGLLLDGFKDRYPLESFFNAWSTYQFCVGIYCEGDEVIDISDTPVSIIMHPINPINDPCNYVCYDVYNGNKLVYHADKNVMNTLILPYKGKKITYNDAKEDISFNRSYYVIGSNSKINSDSDVDQLLILPNPSELSDLYDYDIIDLKLCVDAENSQEYFDWIQSCVNKRNGSPYEEDNIGDIRDRKSLKGILAGIKLNNDDEHHLVVTVDYDSSKSASSPIDFLTFDYSKAYNEYERSAKINYLDIKFVSGRITTALRAFNNFRGHLNFIYENGKPGPKYGFAPTQLLDTFSWGCQLEILKREWIYWNECWFLQSTFEYNSNIKEIQSEDGQFILPRNQNGHYDNSEEYGEYSWPTSSLRLEPKDKTHNIFTRVFLDCNNLQRIEPIIDAKYLPCPESCSGCFDGCTSLYYLRLKNINCFDWDFTSLISLDADSIKYIFDNAQDLVSIKFDESHTNPNNKIYKRVEETDEYIAIDDEYDFVNIRTKKSLNGLKIKCPEQWRDKITNDMVKSINEKGWKVFINDQEYIAS